ncbi:MAG: HU family DNA-binding protein [archaeon]
MIILDLAKRLKEGEYKEVPINELVGVLRDSFETIAKMAVESGSEFILSIPRFGTFRVKKNEARVGYNPKKKEKMNIPEKLVFKLKTSHQLKQALIAISGGKKSKTKSSKKK